jgi:hypothetical protein
MERYKNLNGDSGVVSYEIGTDYIWVVFLDGTRYLYTYARTGAQNVEQMKRLATDGRGLSTFISANHAVRNGYAKKER